MDSRKEMSTGEEVEVAAAEDGTHITTDLDNNCQMHTTSSPVLISFSSPWDLDTKEQRSETV